MPITPHESAAGRMLAEDSVLAQVIARVHAAPAAQATSLRVVIVPAVETLPPGRKTFKLGDSGMLQFLLELLVVDGQRIGEIVQDAAPLPSDYLLIPQTQGCTMLLPARGSARRVAA